jgi:hypothetical protein
VQVAVGIIIGIFIGFLMRPVLDAYMLWRAQEELRNAPIVELADALAEDADLLP